MPLIDFLPHIFYFLPKSVKQRLSKMKVFLILTTLAIVQSSPTSSLLEGILALNYTENVSEWCAGDLQIVEDAIRLQDVWAMKCNASRLSVEED